jgi:hypothetical protein
MTNPLTVEAIYLRLGALIADAPNFKNPTPETAIGSHGSWR